MCEFTIGLGNADCYFVPMRLAKIKKPLTDSYVGEMISLNLHDKNVNCPRTLKSSQTPSNKIYLSSFSLPVPFLGLDALEIKSPVHNDVCSRMFMAALLMVTKTLETKGKSTNRLLLDKC